MEILTGDICRYIDHLIGETHWYVTLHGSLVAAPELMRYNIHLNPYCRFVKTSCGNWEVCVQKQKAVMERCRDGEFFGMCHAGVCEYVYPVACGGSIAGFISVSGFKAPHEQGAPEKALHFAEKNHLSKSDVLRMRDGALIAEVPDKASVDTLLRPLVLMLETYLAKHGTPEAHGTGEELYTRLLHYIASNHTAQLTMGDLSRHFNYSVSTLSHLFKARSGMSISDYIEKLRLDEAKWLLRQSGYSLTEISESLGFCNSAYFSAVFKKRFGVSPREYQKQAFQTVPPKERKG